MAAYGIQRRRPSRNWAATGGRARPDAFDCSGRVGLFCALSLLHLRRLQPDSKPRDL